MKGACESRPWASLDQLGTGTSDPLPSPPPPNTQGWDQPVFPEREIFGGLHLWEGGRAEGRKWCLA